MSEPSKSSATVVVTRDFNRQVDARSIPGCMWDPRERGWCLNPSKSLSSTQTALVLFPEIRAEISPEVLAAVDKLEPIGDADTLRARVQRASHDRSQTEWSRYVREHGMPRNKEEARWCGWMAYLFALEPTPELNALLRNWDTLDPNELIREGAAFPRENSSGEGSEGGPAPTDLVDAGDRAVKEFYSSLSPAELTSHLDAERAIHEHTGRHEEKRRQTAVFTRIGVWAFAALLIAAGLRLLGVY